MATTEIKTLEKLIKEILEKVKNIGEQKSKENYDEAFDKLNTKLETIDERLALPKTEDNVSAEIISKFDQLNTKIEKNAQDYINEIQKAFDNYKQNQSEFLLNAEIQNPDMKKFITEIDNELLDIRNQVSRFNTEFTDISINTSMAVSKEVVSLKNHVLALNDSIENVKKEFFENGSFSKLEEIYNTSFNSFKNDVYSVLAKITDVSKDTLKKFDEFTEELKTFEGLELSIGEIIHNQQKEKAEILKVIHSSIEDENKKLLPQIMQLINSISFDESAEEIKDGLYAINENLGIVNQNIETSSSSSEQMMGQIENVTNLVKDSKDELTDIVKDNLVDKLSQMDASLSNVSNDTLQKVDELLTNVKDSKEELTNIVKDDLVEKISKMDESLSTASTDTLQKIDELSKEFKTFEGIELSVGEIIENQQKNKAEILKIIRKNIEDENKKLLPQIMQLVNSISFDESTEEIKDGLYAINENLGIVNQNIETGSSSTEKILGQIDDVSSLVKGDLIDKLSQMNVYLSDVSNDFATLIKGSKGETDTYIYSLLDLESDISRVRVILDELNHTIQDDRSLAQSVTRNISDKIANLNSFVEQTSLLYTSPDYKEILTQFDALNDDITSISKRTNKLILNSDDASEKLQKNIEDFQKILVKICDTVKNFENSSILKTLNIKTDNMQKMLKSSIQSDRAMNEAFIYLANWIDTTSDEIKSIKDSLSVINNEVKTNIKSEELEAADFGKIEKLLKEINKKLTENTKRIDSLEEKLNNNSVVTTTLEYVSSQVQVINEKLSSNKTISGKIDKMEKQIQQLLSFVEEE